MRSIAVMHRVLLAFYFPFLLLVGMATLALIAYLVTLLGNCALALPVLVPVILLLGLTVLQFVWAARVAWSFPLLRDDMELRLSRKQNSALYDFVERVARQHGVPRPDSIRAAPDTIAHVYEDVERKRILVLGGLAIAGFTQDALAGVIAHELGHFAAGDTGLSRRGFKRVLTIALLESQFSGQVTVAVNPLLWLLRLYHLAYRMVWAAASRSQEYAADEYTVAQVGKAAAGAALIHTTVPERLPWVRLSSIAESCVATAQPMDKIFAEQHRLARAITRSEWQEALRKELKVQTAIFDTHPCLKQRLAALGVSPRKALQTALDQAGPPAQDLFPNWEKLEKELTCRLMQVFREQQQSRRELAQIFKAAGDRG